MLTFSFSPLPSRLCSPSLSLPLSRIDRIYLTPADPKTKTKKLNSTSRTKFQDGWVEFLDKKVAKNVALMLNMTQVRRGKRRKGGREGYFFFF